MLRLLRQHASDGYTARIAQTVRTFAAGGQTPEAAVPDSHWLNKYAPGLKQWLDNQVLEAWLKGLQDRCHSHEALRDKQDVLLPAVRRESAAVMDRHRDATTDSRSETHLQVASVVLASHKVLLPYVRNEGEVLEMLREQNGAKSEEGIRWLSKFGFFCKQVVLRQTPMNQAARMQQGMQSDQGSAFESTFSRHDSGSELKVTKCPYNDILQAEGKPQLLSVCCCSQDASWFDGLQTYGLEYQRAEWLGSGDTCCRMQLREVEKSEA